MVTQNTVISFEQLVQDFDGLFRHRVFRLETLDRYDAPNEREPYARFLAGEPADLTWREPWQRLVRDVRASGRIMQRVHVVSEPVSDYARFEMLHVYPANVEAGEDVRILSRAKARAANLDDEGDYWLFDLELLARLVYDERGAVERVVLERDLGEVGWCAVAGDTMLGMAAPLAQYVAEHNITNERTQAA